VALSGWLVSNPSGGVAKMSLNTGRLTPRNCHVWLGPLPIQDEYRGCDALAVDRRVKMRTAPVALPALYINQALMTAEGFKLSVTSSRAP
jgi:hypothetical protein